MEKIEELEYREEDEMIMETDDLVPSSSSILGMQVSQEKDKVAMLDGIITTKLQDNQITPVERRGLELSQMALKKEGMVITGTEKLYNPRNETMELEDENTEPNTQELSPEEEAKKKEEKILAAYKQASKSTAPVRVTVDGDIAIHPEVLIEKNQVVMDDCISMDEMRKFSYFKMAYLAAGQDQKPEGAVVHEEIKLPSGDPAVLFYNRKFFHKMAFLKDPSKDPRDLDNRVSYPAFSMFNTGPYLVPGNHWKLIRRPACGDLINEKEIGVKMPDVTFLVDAHTYKFMSGFSVIAVTPLDEYKVYRRVSVLALMFSLLDADGKIMAVTDFQSKMLEKYQTLCVPIARDYPKMMKESNLFAERKKIGDQSLGYNAEAWGKAQRELRAAQRKAAAKAKGKPKPNPRNPNYRPTEQ